MTDHARTTQLSPRAERLPTPPDTAVMRRCSCGGKADHEGECTDCKKKRLQRKAESAGPSLAPQSVHQVLAAGGQPLEAGVRSRMQSRLGHDFGSVRIHTDATAARSAADVSARAWTVGSNVAFAEGAYQPTSTAGEELLAHELAHVVQQRSVRNLPSHLEVGAQDAPEETEADAAAAGASSRIHEDDSDTVRLRRCVAQPVGPPAPVPVSGMAPTVPGPRAPRMWAVAERCLQTSYQSAFSSNVIGFNKDWLYFSGRRPPEQEDIDCFKPHFAGPSGMYPAEPDIFDFTATSILEITTVGESAAKTAKLAIEVGLANRLAQDTSLGCSGRLWSPGLWPPSPWYSLGGDLYMSAMNSAGVLIYTVYKDATKELALAALMAALYAAMKKGGGAMGGRAGARAIGGRALGPAYGAATLIAITVLLSTGKAHAQVGPGDQEPIAQMFQALARQGTPVPQELQDSIREYLAAHPDLKAKIEDGARTGNMSAAQQEASRQFGEFINQHRDELSQEEIVALLTAADEASTVGGPSPENVAQLRELARRGPGGGAQSGTERGQTGPAPATGGGRSGATGTTGGPGATTTREGPAGTGGTGRERTGTGGTALSSASQQRIQSAPAPARDLWNAMLGGQTGPRVTDDVVRRFFDLVVPAALTTDEVERLKGALRPVEGQTADDVLQQLQRAIATLRGASDAAPERTAPEALGASGDLGANREGDPATRAALAAQLQALDFAGISAGQGKITVSDTDQPGAIGRHYIWGLTQDGVPFVLLANVRVLGRTQRNLTVRILGASEAVDAQGNALEITSGLVGSTRVFAFERQPAGR